MASDGDADGLASLCTICHINPPKYTCPRCSIRTCSLPCIKRHKTWSECSGVRDPAAFLSKRALATPSAFDRDFNFISGIERTLERADRDVEDRNISMEDPEKPGAKKNMRGWGAKRNQQAALWKAFDEADVAVVKAPVGMTREKQNKTHLTKRKRLFWTIEWVTQDGSKFITHESDTRDPLVTAYYDQYMPQLAKANGEPPAKKQRAAQQAAEKGTDQTKTNEVKPTATENLPVEGEVAESDTPILETTKPSTSDSQAAENGLAEEVEAEDANEEPIEEPVGPRETTDGQPPKPNSSQDPADKAQTRPLPQAPPDLHFYLHRPQTLSKVPVLIPVSPETTISTLLHHQIILEFPTIYMLSYPPSALPTEFYILEEEYEKREDEEKALRALEEGPHLGDGEDASGAEAGEEGVKRIDLEKVDERKVLDVLKRDLSALGAL